LGAVAEDLEVDFLIILETASKDRKKIIPAGPGLDFRSPKDASGKTIGGMRMSAYVDLKRARATPKINKATEQAMPAPQKIASTKERKLQARLDWMEKEKFELENRISGAKKQILTRNQVIDELKKQLSLLQAKLQTSEEANQLPDTFGSRDTDLEAAEEELITRMNQYMEKEAELEQREENLFHRERKLHDQAVQAQQTA
jgi:predicted nuclease with TOPRIM domain